MKQCHLSENWFNCCVNNRPPNQVLQLTHYSTTLGDMIIINLTSKSSLIVLLLASTTAYGECPQPKMIRFVEVVVNSCELLENSRGAVVTGQVYAETDLPYPGFRSGSEPQDWNIVRHSDPVTREYFFFSKSNKACATLTGRAVLLMQESAPCCDVPTVPAHPSCSRKVLRFMPDWLKELGATSDA